MKHQGFDTPDTCPGFPAELFFDRLPAPVLPGYDEATMSRNPDCVFCKIATGAVPAHIVHEDDKALVLLDIQPLAPGHLLVMPRDHYRSLTDMQPDAVAALARLFPRLGQAIVSAAGAEAFNILLNNGVVSGQFVDHVHFHLIPRHNDDGLGYRWPAGRYGPGEAERMRDAYRQHLGRSPHAT